MSSSRWVTAIPGCVQQVSRMSSDRRGMLTKVYWTGGVVQGSPPINIAEIFWSVSTRGVIRGLHFQLPPNSVNKVVWVTVGSIVDVVVDLRRGSPTFAHGCRYELSSSSGALIVPAGCAHGYQVVTESAVVNYAQSGDFHQESDGGISFESLGKWWPIDEIILSDRDSQLPTMQDFDSPFEFAEYQSCE